MGNETFSQDEIIELAKQAGYKDLPTVRLAFQGFDKVAFAKLVTDVATAKEREACAKVCTASDLIDFPTRVEDAAINKCAKAIRARGEECCGNPFKCKGNCVDGNKT